MRLPYLCLVKLTPNQVPSTQLQLTTSKRHWLVAASGVRNRIWRNFPVSWM
ncbi:Uncharacterised protein [Vibrio cholerae]|nr:Uncharacterised protein [Vibrio cholerae]CSI71968.1 Uncharacterised protein [Vibrio cholerae]